MCNYIMCFHICLYMTTNAEMTLNIVVNVISFMFSCKHFSDNNPVHTLIRILSTLLATETKAVWNSYVGEFFFFSLGWKAYAIVYVAKLSSI